MSKRFFAVLVLFILLGGISFAPVIHVIAVFNRKNPSQRFYSAEGCRNGFIISYTHSVNKGRVKDFYKIYKEQNIEKLLCYKTVFLSYGAGIPEPQEMPDAVFSVTDSGYEISNINRAVEKLVMAVGIIANHAIAFSTKKDSKECFFTDFFEAQTSIVLQIKRISLIEYIFHRIK